MNICGIIWDYDGTIINSAKKNIKVTIEVLKHFDKDIEKHLPYALQTYENYQEANHMYKNWRELYLKCYGLKEEELDEAGELWTPEQLKNKTIPSIFEGMVELLKNIKHIKMGICSQNSNENIRETLKYYGVDNCFDAVIGYDDILGSEQKPDPAGFIKCIEQLKLNNEKGTFIYIGDHSEDIVFGKNAQVALNEEDINVICITVDFFSLNLDTYNKWTKQPDYFVQTTDELNSVLNKLIFYSKITKCGV
ncbi:HAD-IA family hydrolase [Clostridium sp. D53t1_180928_C8]|uniref:HAD family hydrolase n=1 Tax=Clostridium sp. D53t1_180928_C8 TaxID=2787101 RepID=UPI0018AB33BC|nr:HAD-IA family hydrolase [Clostridium sp. D53t1_180928_C8]